jgi:hypothetical protein
MKKTIAILLILVIGMVGVFAANNSTHDLKLSTTVAAKYGLVISTSKAQATDPDPVTETPGVTLVESFAGLSSKASVIFEDTNNSGPLYVNYMTNQRILATVTTTMHPLSPVVPENGSNDVTTKIGYTVTVVGGDTGGQTNVTYSVASSSLGVSATFITESAITDGLRVNSREFSIALNEADWAAASATQYSTTWTVTLLTN